MGITGTIGGKPSSLDTDAVYLKKSDQTQKNTALDAKTQALKDALAGADGGEDTVNLSVSQAIQAAFGGDDSADRAKKLADLKAKIASGDYKPDSRLVAKELASEIAQSVFFSADSGESKDPSLF